MRRLLHCPVHQSAQARSPSTRCRKQRRARRKSKRWRQNPRVSEDPKSSGCCRRACAQLLASSIATRWRRFRHDCLHGSIMPASAHARQRWRICGNNEHHGGQEYCRRAFVQPLVSESATRWHSFWNDCSHDPQLSHNGLSAALPQDGTGFGMTARKVCHSPGDQTPIPLFACALPLFARALLCFVYLAASGLPWGCRVQKSTMKSAIRRSMHPAMFQNLASLSMGTLKFEHSLVLVITTYRVVTLVLVC